MISENWRPVEFSNRIKGRIQERGARGDIAKCLAELVKNCDDSYYRLEKRGTTSSGKIEIGYWHSVMKKRNVLTGFYVRDWGEGMTPETIRKAYESYGEDTAFGGRNAAIGVGGKDALYGMEQCFVISVKDGSIVYTKIRTNKVGVGKILECTGAKLTNPQILDEINKDANLWFEPLSIEKNGTIVLFRIPKNSPHPHLSRLRERLENYYTLRNILENPGRKVFLVDVKKGSRQQISRNPKEGELINQSMFDSVYREQSFEVEVVVKKAKEQLVKDRDVGYNLLVQDEEGAVLDNILFGFETYTAANQFFGTVTIRNWRALYKIDEMVLTDNREGLDFSNEFNKILREKVSTILKPLIEASSNEQKKASDLEAGIRRRIKDAFAYINKLVEKEAGGEYEGESEPEGIKPEGLLFFMPSIKLLLGQEKKLYLYFNPDRVPPNSVILIDVNGDGVQVDPPTFVRTPLKYDKGETNFLRLTVKGTKLDGHTILRASYNELETETEIQVISEEAIAPNGGFAFNPEKVTISKGQKKKLRLIIDTRVVQRGRVVTVESLNDGIEVLYRKFVVLPPNLGDNLREEWLPVEAKAEKVHTQIIARTMANGKEVEASCSVKVAEKEPPRQFLTGFRLDKERDGHQRASYEKGIVYVHVSSPVLTSYFGVDQDRLNKEKEADAIAILADTILQCVTNEWAKYLLEKGVEIALGSNLELEKERIRNKLEYKYGAIIHSKISARALGI